MPLTRRRAARIDITPRSSIVGVQRGLSSMEIAEDVKDITIAAVVPALTRCRLLGVVTFGPTDTPMSGIQRSHVTMQLLNSTTLRFSRHISVPVTGPNNPFGQVSWEVTSLP